MLNNANNVLKKQIHLHVVHTMIDIFINLAEMMKMVK